MLFQFLFRHCKTPKKIDSDLEPWMLELLKNIEVEDKEKLEETYGVEFYPDSLRLSCLFITSFCDDFKEASNHDKEWLLKDHIVKILDAACRRVTCNLPKVVEEDGSDLEYLLHRACVELVEIGKEKEHVSSKFWIHRVRKEYEDLMDTWHKCKRKWKPLLLSNSQMRAQELGMLNQVHKDLVSYLQDEEATKELEASTRLLRKLNNLRAKIELSINKDLKEILTVRESDIVEAARRILSIPALLSSEFFKPNHENLETRLAKRVFGQEHAIHAITSALSGPHSGKGPIRSFLFINGSKCGGEELIKALAEQVFYDEDRVIEFDLAKNIEDDSIISHDVRHFREKLIDAVNKMPSSVILLHNIDKVPASVIDFLHEILRNGKIADDKGKMIDFTKMLIIMTSNVLPNLDPRRRWNCNCAFFPGKLFLKEKMEDHDCPYMSLLKDAKQHFKPQLLDIIDNMIFFKLLSHPEFRSFSRLQIRKLANSIGGGRIIVYPSEAALYIIAPVVESYYECLKPYLEQIVVPKLLEICNQSRRGRSIVYIDTLVGTDVLSYRVEMDGYLTGDQEIGQFLAYLSEFWNMYKREISWLRNINGLRKTLQFINRKKNNGDLLPLERLADKIRKLVGSENGVNSIPRNLQMNGFFTSANIGRSDQLKKRAKEIEGLLIKLRTRLVAKHYAFNVVANAILGCTEVVADNSRPMTALLLGLTTNGKANLERDLTKLVHDENNGTTDILVQINLSQCSDYDEFFKLLYAGHNHHGLCCPRRVGMRLGSVVLIDQVEKAPMSVFSGLISLLDYRILTHHSGACTIDLRDAVIIMVSDLGNRDFIVEIFENASSNWWLPLDSNVSENSKQPEKGRFRFELLNRVDEVVFFNPCVGDQLTSFARLSMTDGPHLKCRTPPGSLCYAFMQLFDESNLKQHLLSKVCMVETVELLSTGFLTHD
ncbi:hypothetical protein PTKIN_Ptkin18bG0136200 [Pterospermum kingtungense]